MSNYLKDRFIDNPQNIKRVGGDLPTSQSSNKNILLLIVVLGAMSLTFSTVWAYLNFYTGSTPLTVLIILVVYVPIILKVLSVTLLDEAGNKKAFVDQMENEISSLSTIWEIQNNKQVNYQGTDIGYIDYIDGSRSVIFRMVMGSTMGKHDSLIKAHYDSLEGLLRYIDNAGYYKDLFVVDESISDDEVMNFYYKSLHDNEDEKYVKTFTAMLDHIDLVTVVKGSVSVLYLDINGWGANKHIMFRELASLPEVLGNDNFFIEAHFLNELELNRFIADDNAINSFDIEELKLFKYRNSVNIGRTAVLAARDAEGNIVKTFNNKYEAKDNITVRSKSLGGKSNKKQTDAQVKDESIKRLQQLEQAKKKKQQPRETNIQFKHSEGEEFEVKRIPTKELFLQLMQEDEVELGAPKPSLPEQPKVQPTQQQEEQKEGAK